MNLNNLRGQLSSRGQLSGGLTAGAGGTSDYELLENKPQINGRELIDNQTGHDLGLANLTDVSDLASDVALLAQKLPKSYSTEEQNTGIKWIDGKFIYQKTEFINLIDTPIDSERDVTVNLSAFNNTDMFLLKNVLGRYKGEKTNPYYWIELVNTGGATATADYSRVIKNYSSNSLTVYMGRNYRNWGTSDNRICELYVTYLYTKLE